MKLFNHSRIKPNIFTFLFFMISCATHAETNELLSNQYQDVTGIRLENIRMKVDIKTHDEDHVKVKVFGPKEQQDIVQVKQDGAKLIVQQTKASYTVGDVSVITHSMGKNNNSRSVVTIGGKTTVVEGNGVVITQGNSQPPMNMEIIIPAGTPLSLVDFSGKASIGDIRSSFRMQGSGKVIAGNLADVDLDIDKNAKIEINQVERNLSITAAGNSKLRLKHGDVEQLQAKLSGNSKVKYEGHAQKGNFSVTDNGKLFVSSIAERGASTISRNGRATVGNW